MSPDVATGTMRWFNGARGYGFIVPAAGGADLFVHRSQIHDYNPARLAAAQSVEFQVGTGRNGRHACSVRVI
ncbi:cold-shock protein [Actinokineospora inagensis]|uniref:cold-shock protein n=1 Tax=Actinokineospora inagensis TaxID=103730 RepID=UPI0003F6D0B6|nr:cold shock domain-containing protein [Actinokineospora inagensis]